jgi:hypothetical protein
VSAVEGDPQLCSAPIRRRYDGLVGRLLEGLDNAIPPGVLVVVVDALDQCGATETRKAILDCLCNMSQLVP